MLTANNRTFSRTIRFLQHLRKYANKIQAKIEISPNVLDDIKSAKVNPSNHCGVFKPAVYKLPDEFVNAVVQVSKDYPVKAIWRDSETLVNRIRGRHPPATMDEVVEKKREAEIRVLGEPLNEELSRDELKEILNQNRSKLLQSLNALVHNWQPFQYDNYLALQYLYGRSAAEYAAISRVFGEIRARDPDFKPRAYFDFGSGCGTGIWAAHEHWGQSLFEYFCVDMSSSMNDLALSLLKGGNPNRKPCLKGGVHFRQFLSVRPTPYDVVLSAYSLFELPSLRSRLQTILNLWNKTNRYLVIIEYGSNSGFKLVNEARDYILNIKNPDHIGHVFAPCPHSKPCPRFTADDGHPCNFGIRYATMPIQRTSQICSEKFAFVVLRKGGQDSDSVDFQAKWPRVVRPTKIRSKHCRSYVCGSHGHLEELVFTKRKYDKLIYQCGRRSRWGDLLPMKITFPREQIPSSDTTAAATESLNESIEMDAEAEAETEADDEHDSDEEYVKTDDESEEFEENPNSAEKN